jgi:hypothetical protein
LGFALSHEITKLSPDRHWAKFRFSSLSVTDKLFIF